ncbi:helix-turn-helix domain-containing protein [Novosphingobium sp. NBM11]|uniref:helix-turn-helix domain-containing protein n=1 Tax=Novosphingobium sp. NBM11 TaxID=2596914 RepID=UPI001892425E|nr:helix-turn-helix domain-containing protein [Novosphingobium sp. NBM11]MBF5091011.1 helix-turn-helix domain-containing protein [Novosphingobium sp. NBM11]
MQFLTLPKLAEQSGWSVTRVRRMVANRELPHIRVNGRLLLPANAIDDFVAKNIVSPASEPRGGREIQSQSNPRSEVEGDAA